MFCLDGCDWDWTYSEENRFGFVWFDGNEVVGYHGQFVSVDGKELLSFCSGVDQSQSMRLSFLKLEFGDRGVVCAGSLVVRGRAVEEHLSIDEVIV